MIKRRKHKRMGLREETRVRCPEHLKWIRNFQCAVYGSVLGHGSTHWHHTCCGKVEAAHVRTSTDGAMGIKPGDNWAIPLCSAAHREQHNMGEEAFESEYKIDMKRIATKLWNMSKARVKYEQRKKAVP